MKISLNPFFYYILVFFSILIIYPLGWSDLQVDLEWNLTSFIMATMFLSVIFGFIYNFFFNTKVIIGHQIKENNFFLWCFLILGVTIEILHAGVIPIIEIIMGRDYKYHLFGIPVFHVFFLPYISAVGIYSLYKYILFKSKQRLYIYIFSILFAIIIFNRGAICFILLTSFFMYFSMKVRINIRGIFLSFIFFIASLYTFGLMGNSRMVSSGYNSEEAILLIGQANDNFEKFLLPNEFFWSYLYFVSPYANLQYQSNNISNVDFYNVFKYQILFDFIQKRTFIDNKDNNLLLTDELNVSTLYGRTIQVAGFGGAIILYFWFVFLVFVITILADFKSRKPVMALFCSIAIFTFFTNILVFSGFIFQPIFIAILSRLKFGKFNLF